MRVQFDLVPSKAEPPGAYLAGNELERLVRHHFIDLNTGEGAQARVVELNDRLPDPERDDSAVHKANNARIENANRSRQERHGLSVNTHGVARRTEFDRLATERNPDAQRNSESADGPAQHHCRVPPEQSRQFNHYVSDGVAGD